MSHLHPDHWDPRFLRDCVSKDATVILPDFPLDRMEREMRSYGFHTFLRTENARPVEIAGLRLLVKATVAPTDGPIGDSGLILDDGETCIYDQNDSKPADLDFFAEFDRYHAHFVQYSGALWYPMVYFFPEKMQQALGRKKRENGRSYVYMSWNDNHSGTRPHRS